MNNPISKMKTEYKIIITTLLFLITEKVLYAQLYSNQIIAVSGSTNLFTMIQQGGWSMLPLGICSLAVLFLIFYCWIETDQKKFIPKTNLENLSQSMSSRDIKSSIEILRLKPTILSSALIPALGRVRPKMKDANRTKIETTLIENLEKEENSVGQWINYINVVAAIAPMIGLLGTVSGMIGAFQTIAKGGMGRPELLAGDIGEALITTATGLVIGIPAMIAYFILRNRLNNVMQATIQTATTLIDYLAGDIEYEDK